MTCITTTVVLINFSCKFYHRWTTLYPWWTKKKWLHFGSYPRLSPDSRFLEEFFKIARTFFHTLARISGLSDYMFMKILREIYLWTRKSN